MKIAININDLVPKPTPATGAQTGAVGDLPDINLLQFLSIPIRTILGWTMIFTIAALVGAGIYYIIARGNEDETKKAKDILFYLVIGMAIIGGAYGIVAGISQFEFFE